MSTILAMLQKTRRAVIARGARVEDADDIIQEAFARMESYLRVHAVANQEAFLLRVALNIGRDQARREKRAPFSDSPLALELVADASPQPDEILRARERLRRAKAGLDQLDSRTRRYLLAQRLDGLTFPQIAEREGVALTTVEKRVARAVIFLMKWMDGW